MSPLTLLSNKPLQRTALRAAAERPDVSRCEVLVDK
jgi:hypothetical protein